MDRFAFPTTILWGAANPACRLSPPPRRDTGHQTMSLQPIGLPHTSQSPKPAYARAGKMRPGLKGNGEKISKKSKKQKKNHIEINPSFQRNHLSVVLPPPCKPTARLPTLRRPLAANHGHSPKPCRQLGIATMGRTPTPAVAVFAIVGILLGTTCLFAVVSAVPVSDNVNVTLSLAATTVPVTAVSAGAG